MSIVTQMDVIINMGNDIDRYKSVIGQEKKYNLPGMESFVAPLTILKGHQTTSRETADHSANSPKTADH
jgi:hypothetical protein